MKILHFADSHIGVTTNGIGDSRIYDFLETMDYIVDYIEDKQVDLVLFAGDLYDKHTPNATLLKEVSIRLRDISDIATLILIPGNHDMKMVGTDDTPVGIFSNLYIDNMYASDVPKVIEVETTGGRAVVALLPYPRLSTYTYGKIDDADKRQEVFDLSVSQMLDKLAQEARELKGNDPCFLVGHFTVRGCDFGHGRLAFGNDSYINPQQLKDGPWDYVALGHIHKHQVLVDDPPVIYSGSMDRVDFGEEYDDKGFIMIESVGPVITWKFVPVPVRPMVTYQYDLRGEPNPQRRLISKLEYESLLEDSIVRIIVQCDFGAEISLRKIRKVLSGVHYVAQINIERERPERGGRVADLEVDTEEFDKVDWLEIYYHGIGVAVEERDALHDLFIEITEEVEDA